MKLMSTLTAAIVAVAVLGSSVALAQKAPAKGLKAGKVTKSKTIRNTATKRKATKRRRISAAAMCRRQATARGLKGKRLAAFRKSCTARLNKRRIRTKAGVRRSPARTSARS